MGWVEEDMRLSEAGKARLLLVLLIIGWGVTWPLMRIALVEIPPLTMRAGNLLVGLVTLVALARARGRRIGMPRRGIWLHVVAAATLNIVVFSVLTPFAQLWAATSRVAIIVYSMPIWASLLAPPVLGERLDAIRIIALLFCATGMAVLALPLMNIGSAGGLLLALGAASSWGAGTVYMKWARLDGDPLAVTIWQLLVAVVALGFCALMLEPSLNLSPVHLPALVAFVLSGLIGSGISNFLWFDTVRRLPAATASLAILGVPVVGVLSSMVLLGERPTAADMTGFAMILAASACVVLWPEPARPRPSR
jgi:drug/metabolite transporter (DMT)-like permease